jgi:hypothetical protein
MKQHLLLFVAAIAAAGCGKSSDLAPVAAEANSFVKNFDEQGAALDGRAKALDRRVQELGARGAIPPEFAPAKQQLDLVMGLLLPRMSNGVKEAGPWIARTLGDDKLDEGKKLDELRAYTQRLRNGLTNDWIAANEKLGTVEAWLARIESQPRMQAAPPPPPPPSPEGGAAGGTFPAGDPKATGNDAGNAAR